MPSDELKIVTVIGARPQFIKAAAVSRAILACGRSGQLTRSVSEIIVHTGQHYDEKMSKLFFDELEIPRPKYNLGVGSASHGAQTGAMLAGIEEILQEEKPGLVLIYGDTNSTLAGALSASKMHILSAHVEAGLRSYNRLMPEEINRIVADKVSNFLFCPTETAMKNLEKEGITNSNCPRTGFDFNSQMAFNVGDVMYDSIIFNEHLSAKKSSVISDLGLKSTQADIRPYCLATIHRQENTDDPENLLRIVNALIRISAQCKIVLPLHPRTAKCLRENGELPGLSNSSLVLIDPVGYLDMIQLEKHARAIMTDSGGVQKEAFMLGVPCITLRNETEWVETVYSGWNTLAGADPGKIETAFSQIQEKEAGAPPFPCSDSFAQASPENRLPYGNGKASERIIHMLSEIVGR